MPHNCLNCLNQRCILSAKNYLFSLEMVVFDCGWFCSNNLPSRSVSSLSCKGLQKVMELLLPWRPFSFIQSWCCVATKGTVTESDVWKMHEAQRLTSASSETQAGGGQSAGNCSSSDAFKQSKCFSPLLNSHSIPRDRIEALCVEGTHLSINYIPRVMENSASRFQHMLDIPPPVHWWPNFWGNQEPSSLPSETSEDSAF